MKKTFTTEEIESILKSTKTNREVTIQIAPDPEKTVDYAYLKQVAFNALNGVDNPHVVYKAKR